MKNNRRFSLLSVEVIERAVTGETDKCGLEVPRLPLSIE